MNKSMIKYKMVIRLKSKNKISQERNKLQLLPKEMKFWRGML